MTSRIKIFSAADVPTDLAQAWLQHLRDFDVAHPGCHFEVGMDGPDIPLRQMIEMLQINPGLSFQTIFERARK